MATKTKSSKPTILAPRANSRKAKVFGVFKTKGKDEAIKYGRVSLHLKSATLANWVSVWSNSNVKERNVA